MCFIVHIARGLGFKASHLHIDTISSSTYIDLMIYVLDLFSHLTWGIAYDVRGLHRKPRKVIYSKKLSDTRTLASKAKLRGRAWSFSALNKVSIQVMSEKLVPMPCTPSDAWCSCSFDSAPNSRVVQCTIIMSSFLHAICLGIFIVLISKKRWCTGLL